MDDYKYLGIVNWAKQVINERSLSIGDRFYSENELCDIHKVSRQTVRQALASMENQGILRRKQGSGTFIQNPKVDLFKQKLTVGIISTYFSDYIFPSIITGIERKLTRNNTVLQLMTTSNQVAEEARVLEAMLSQNISGLIVEPSKSAMPNPNTALFDEIRARRIPLVFFNAKYPWSEYPVVAMDDVAAGQIVTDYLFSLGHERIAGIFAFDNMQGHKRFQGFIKSCGEHGCPIREQRIMWFPARDQAMLFVSLADSLTELINEATAVVCYNDSLAVELLEFCKRQDRSVPGDLSVVGIDDASVATVCDPQLTTVRHPKNKLGEMAADILLKEIDDPLLLAEDFLFTPTLVKRASAAPVESNRSAIGGE